MAGHVKGKLMINHIGSVALLVARRTNDRKIAGSRPIKVVCITVLTGNRMGVKQRCGSYNFRSASVRRQVKSSQVAFNKKAMTIALHVHNVQTIHKSKYKNYETRNTMSIRYTMSREIVNCAN